MPTTAAPSFGLSLSGFLLPPSASQVPPAALSIVQSNLADVLWFMGMEIDAEEQPEVKKQYIALVTTLVKKRLLGEELLISRLENDVLQEVGLIKDAGEFHKKQVRMNTKALYTQQKYNLFREETEGYSKLIAELSELPTATEHTSTRGCKSAAEVIQNLQSLIGYFDLDPNRVLDLVLEALEAVPARVANRALVSLFNPNFIPHMVGFKFSLYAVRGAPAPPTSLYTMCGLLLSHGTVKLAQVLPHLSPSVRAMQDMDAKRVSQRLAAAKKYGVTLLGSGGGGGAAGGAAPPPRLWQGCRASSHVLRTENRHAYY
jgi:THO complex subunit 2